MRGVKSAAGNGGTLTSAEKRTLRCAGLVPDLDLARLHANPGSDRADDARRVGAFTRVRDAARTGPQPGHALGPSNLRSRQHADRNRRRIELEMFARHNSARRGQAHRSGASHRNGQNGIAAASERDGPLRLNCQSCLFANVGNDLNSGILHRRDHGEPGPPTCPAFAVRL